MEAAYITGYFAVGIDSEKIEIALVGSDLDKNFIDSLVEKAENRIDHKIIFLLFPKNQME